ncbi:RDD family protein [Agromyces sp. ISL-38]|uniref:RDD family protein n=1 Tax=Agromyces sp. ISL-38 TaxID=2819107 RepID=UPI001BEA3EF6|nr:RDD family protein [Agromyces sp. ISL-38]MBT2498634.1 RDD family protein [Agromyces sp. ISL-38]MBT2518502.1 RDD family protein [Streptomyces sp. ISL-90]
MSVTLDVDDEPTPGLDADGRPDPAYAAGLGILPAPAGRRAAAFAVDAAIWCVLAAPGVIGASLLLGAVIRAAGDVTVIAGGDLVLPLVLTGASQGLLVIFGLVQLILHGRKALTLGKAALGLRSVNVARLQAPGFWRIVWRAIVLWGAQVVLPLVGPAVLFASSKWDPEQRGRSWLDRVGRSYVIDIRRGLNPFDAKALRHARRALAAPPAAVVSRLPSLATDRGPDEHTFIPAARSSSGVVSAGAGAEWVPPAIGGSPARSAAPAAPESRGVQAGGTPAAPAPTRPTPAAAPSERVWLLVFDDGTQLEAPARGLIGRAPAPPSAGAHALLVPLTDESMRISKTHAEFGVDAAGFWISDRASRNGTAVEFPDGAARTLEAGSPTRLPAGSRVTLGGRSFTISFESRGRR